MGSLLQNKTSLKIELKVSCTDLLKRDALSNSDPVCILWEKKDGEWEEFKRTEELKNSLNPQWKTEFVLDYKFEKRQLLKFEIIDIDENKVDPLGQMECSLGVNQQQSLFIDTEKKNRFKM